MRNIFLILSKIIFLSPLLAQVGFNIRYSSQVPSAVFYNLLLDGDSLVVYGVGIDSQQYILTGKVDTLGSFSWHRKIRDSPGNNYTSNLNYDIIKGTNGNYFIVGENGAKRAFVCEISFEGNVLSLHKYFDPNILVVFLPNIIETNTGYLISGHKQKTDYSADIFIAKIDSNGGKIWEKSYGLPGVEDISWELYSFSSDKFIVTGSHSNSDNTPLSQWWAQSWIFAIDSLGNKLWEFEGPVNEEINAIGIQPTPSGGWIYGSGTFELLPNNDWGSTTKVVCRDSAMNLLWETPISPTTYSTNKIEDIKLSPDGNYVVIGRWTTHQIPGMVNYRGGSITKITPNGAILWNHIFSAYPNQIAGSRNFLGGVEVLPSGSIVAAGYSERFHPSYVAPQGWIIKISPDGCVVDTLCITSSATEWASQQLDLKVYPNPAQDNVTFEFLEDAGPGIDIVVFDVLGNLVWEYHGEGPEKQIVWDLSSVPAGIYFYVIKGNANNVSGKIVIK
jgi:Secretion system C-terminal sorting domain